MSTYREMDISYKGCHIRRVWIDFKDELELSGYPGYMGPQPRELYRVTCRGDKAVDFDTIDQAKTYLDMHTSPGRRR